MLTMGSIFLSLIVAPSSTLKHTLSFKQSYDDTDALCPFIVYCVTEFETVFRGLIFWRFLLIPSIGPNKVNVLQ